MRRTIFIFFILCGAAGVLLVSCPEQGNKITFWVMPNTTLDEHLAWLERKKAEFFNTTGIEVACQIVSWGDSWKKIEKALDSGNEADVIQLRSTWTGYHAARGRLQELSINDFGGRDSFVSSLFASSVYGGKSFAVPWFGETAVLFCNDDLLKQAGVNPPQTIPELFTAAKKIIMKTGRGTALALPGVNSPDLVNYWSSFLYSYGGGFLTDDQKQTRFAGEEGVQSIQAFVSLYSEGFVPRAAIEYNTADAEKLFFQGKAAMCFLSPAGARTLAGQYPTLKVSPTALPAGPRGSLPYVLGTNLVIPEKSRNRNKAARWINFLLSDENLYEYTHTVIAAIPSRKKTLERREFSSDSWRVFQAALVSAVPFPATPAWLGIERETGEALKLMLIALYNGKYKPDMAKPSLDKAALAVNSALLK